MSLLIRIRSRFSPFSTSSPEVRRSVAINAAVVRPRGAIHFPSFEFRWKGDVQMARWSFKMLTKNFFSRLGVGVACGFGAISVGDWANVQCTERKIMTRTKAHAAPADASKR